MKVTAGRALPEYRGVACLRHNPQEFQPGSSQFETRDRFRLEKTEEAEYSRDMNVSARKLKRPDIFSAQDYREYLREFYQFEKQNDVEFSYRVFSARAGFKSPNFLKLVIEGQRNLTVKSIRGIVTALDLGQEEAQFFKNLVLVNQAKTSTEKNQQIRELYKSKVFRELYPLKQAELEFYQNWYCVPIREMIASPAFREDPAWIAKNLRGAITAEEAKGALKTLEVLGLVVRDENGRLRQNQKNLTTGNEVHSVAVADFHRQMLGLAANSIDQVKRYQRDISSSTVLISESTFHHLKELIQNFRKTLLAEAESGVSKKDHAVYQIGLQLFPLTDFIHVEPDSEGGEPGVCEGLCKKVS